MKEEVLNEVRSNLAGSVADVANMTAVLATERSEKLVLEKNNSELERRVQQEDRLSSDLRAEQQKLEKRLRDLKEGAQKKLNELAGRNVRLERVADADSREQTRLRLELGKATGQLEESKREIFALSQQLPLKVPNDALRAFIHFNVRSTDVIHSGTAAEWENFRGFRPEQESFLMQVDVSTMPGWRINEIMCDTSARRHFIDEELRKLGNTPELLRLLSARFPALIDQVPEVVEHWGARSFAQLEKAEKDELNNSVEQQQATAKDNKDSDATAWSWLRGVLHP
jgi:hypothetical protein